MRRWGKALLISAAQGISLLGLARVMEGWLGFKVAFTPATAGVCLLLGPPGAVLLLAVRLVCRL